MGPNIGYYNNYGTMTASTLTKHCFCHYTIYDIDIACFVTGT